jgi:DNA (cytosine-5)-methyltransferase 1
LRSFFREFPQGKAPDEYYEYLRNIGEPEDLRRQRLFAKFQKEASTAKETSWLAELGEADRGTVHERIAHALNGSDHWILIGGPPCQAYSLVGRSRNKNKPNYVPEEDKRQRLYLEYIQVLADHLPTVFVMENVEGLLSATLEDRKIFERMVEDLQRPQEALARAERSVAPRKGTAKIPRRYRVVSLVDKPLIDDHDLRRFVVRMEEFGIPQARHRVIILGIREDLAEPKYSLLAPSRRRSILQAISGLPRLRSGLSKGGDDFDKWSSALRASVESRWFAALPDSEEALGLELLKTVANLRHPRSDRGAEFLPADCDCDFMREWFLDPRLGGVCNHSSRGHIPEDLQRYLFAACFTEVYEHSPALRDFPKALLPKHENVQDALNGSMFADRFRVQARKRPATTITSHIAKDGHYYIHYDASQCRSLTVREAARLQTFPDNYFFCGPRTAQYSQVGNAVPPLLAVQVARIVAGLFKEAGL